MTEGSGCCGEGAPVIAPSLIYLLVHSPSITVPRGGGGVGRCEILLSRKALSVALQMVVMVNHEGENFCW